MPLIVTITVTPVDPGSEQVRYQYLQATATDYESARDDAMARVPQGWRAIAIRADGD